jgi:hypothetical protein
MPSIENADQYSGEAYGAYADPRYMQDDSEMLADATRRLEALRAELKELEKEL